MLFRGHIIPVAIQRSNLNFSFPAHKHRIQFRQRDLEPGRAAVVALAGAFGLLHFAQQRVHLGDTQDAVGAHRAVAGEGGAQLITTFGSCASCATASFSACLSSAGIARPTIWVGDSGAMSKPSILSASCSASTVATSSGSA